MGKEASCAGDGLEGGCLAQRREVFVRKENRSRRHKVIRKLIKIFYFLNFRNSEMLGGAEG